MINVYGEDWLQIKAWAEEQLKRARDDLEHEFAGQRQSNNARGRIRVLLDLLALPTKSSRKGQDLGISPIDYMDA